MVWGASMMCICEYYINLSMAILPHNNRLLLTTATTKSPICAKIGHWDNSYVL